MDFPKYDGNIHPNEWINDIKRYFVLKNIYDNNNCLRIAISFVDPIISLPAEIDSLEKLCSVLKEDTSFAIFKNTNKRKLQSLKYIPEKKGGDTSKFISTFRKLCYNAEINDIEEQKDYLYNSLPLLTNHFDSLSTEYYKKMEDVNSINELIKEFEDFTLYLSNLIVNNSIVTLKHVATGKFLGSNGNLHYTTGSESQLVYVENSKFDSNSLWRIKFNGNLATYTDTSITLQHVKSNRYLGINYGKRDKYSLYRNYNRSPSTNHTEVISMDRTNKYILQVSDWKVKHAKVANHQGFLKSNDIINLSIKTFYDNNGDYNQNGHYEFLRSHDIQFTIGNDNFQEVVCHNERLGGNDEWCIELIDQYYWT